MNVEQFRDYCIQKKEVTETFPFNKETLVYKVMDKMFALANLESFERISLKCDPEKAVMLREEYESVTAGYHLNKKHWNTIYMDGTIGDKQIKTWIDDSYDLVVAGLPKSKRALLMNN